MTTNRFTVLRRLTTRARSGYRTRAGRERMIRVLLPAAGAAVTIAQALIWLGDLADSARAVLLLIIPICLIGAVLIGLPPTKVTGSLQPQSQAEIELRIGDLLETADPIAIGISDQVDNDFPNKLHPSTLLAQLSETVGPLDLRSLRDLLWKGSGADRTEPLPIGHVVELPRPNGEVAYILVFANLEVDVTTSTPTTLMVALNELWRRVRVAKHREIHLPVLGSGYGGSQLSRAAMLSIIAISFTLASGQSKVCDRLIIDVPDRNYIPEDFVSFRATLRGLGYRV